MTSENFCYWLQGLFEIGGNQVKTLDETQVQVIKNHLKLVFYYDIDPKQTSDPKEQSIMQRIHDGIESGAIPVTRLELPLPEGPMYNHMSPDKGYDEDGTLYRC